MYIAHDIFVKIKRESDDRAARKQELSNLKKELSSLKSRQDLMDDDDSD